MRNCAGWLWRQIRFSTRRRIPTQLSSVLICGYGNYEVPPSTHLDFNKKTVYNKLRFFCAGMATTKCRHRRIDMKNKFQRKNLHIKNGCSFAGMAKLVDALDLGSSGETHKSSTLFTRTTNFNKKNLILRKI